MRFGDAGVGSAGVAGVLSSSVMEASASTVGGGGREQGVVERLGEEELARFGEVEETPIEEDGEEWEEFPFAIGEDGEE